MISSRWFPILSTISEPSILEMYSRWSSIPESVLTKSKVKSNLEVSLIPDNELTTNGFNSSKSVFISSVVIATLKSFLSCPELLLISDNS
ncbi:hypothetical protein D3C73_736350 [compost metagenome]